MDPFLLAMVATITVIASVAMAWLILRGQEVSTSGLSSYLAMAAFGVGFAMFIGKASMRNVVVTDGGSYQVAKYSPWESLQVFPVVAVGAAVIFAAAMAAKAYCARRDRRR